jgi:peptidoglycan/xylan/chitin deacetylase (PgdA/CDA1 family)
VKVPRSHGISSVAPEDQEQAVAKPRAAATATAGKPGLGRVPMILMYHNIVEVAEDPMQLCVAPTRFAEQMSWLKAKGLRGVGIRTLIDAMRAGRERGLVGITFDDGYGSVLEAAVPELLRHGFTATMFIISDRLGGSNEWCESPAQPLMSAEQVGELAAVGMEVGSHAATHVRLAGIGPAQLEAEVSGSRATIGELIGAPVRGFAYPYGSMDAAARRAVRDAGYDYACATETPVAELGIMALPRIGVWERDGPRRLAAKRLLFTGDRRQLAAKRLLFRGYNAVKGRLA